MAKMREAAAHWILMHELPFSVMEEEGFNMMQRCGMPEWEKVSRIAKACYQFCSPSTSSPWGIENKVFTISVDNASSNDVAIRILKDTFSRTKRLLCGGKLFHVRCCAHILNLMVQDGISEIEEIIEDIHESVKFINQSEARLKSFSDIVQQLQLLERKLILDCKTRWNSTFEMLSIFYRVKMLLDKRANDENDFIRAMIGKMKAKFDKYWGECNLLMSVAAVLDPRCKMRVVDFTFARMYSDREARENIAKVREALHEIYEEYVCEYQHGNEHSGETPMHNNDDVGTSGKGSSGWSEFSSYVKSIEKASPQQSDLDAYLAEETVQSLLCGGDWCRNLHGVKKKNKVEIRGRTNVFRTGPESEPIKQPGYGSIN
ncbi:zinc finger BED domain-containing protein RICESLEEPER 2-like [Dioscorea cayenensis subsp. rotundata]|uniref:Zinc finger BED domain-containing protein RICESLEEPER 2-like n=1 Tax=Dioscorea cayennensis subsp. rotundata TaxID=55577 RepID=A0AB40B4L9_DIOCR|nr:zinc finger BED domain-containing protein RICESLEEPER 2-like [Dioscorea cayenensis subsp. rotundata]